jgi:hypothetical protein
MAFALQLEASLRNRESLAPHELANGDGVDAVLSRYLLAIEAAADTDMLTSILLLDGNKLRHGAAPSLPLTYCSAIDGIEIGPKAGSCGTAAYCGHPIYVTDIATDALWDDYRDLALEHGLCACWSTPIFDEKQTIVGTFAIYHLTPRSPTRDEVRAIETITEHVARAITWSIGAQEPSVEEFHVTVPVRPPLRLVVGASENQLSVLKIISDFDALIEAIDKVLANAAVSEPESAYISSLRRAKATAEKGKALAQRHASRD